MGVTGLWSILQPCARPTDISTLNRKRLAVDASIWIYQFLKAVRDKEGNALRNSHVVGFFRRICKLLFFGIKPVFVFDGGAPILKRQTVSGRKQRREGRREDAVRTAGKLLAMQMQRRAEEDERKRKDQLEVARRAPREEEEEAIPENMVYVDELQMTPQERQQNRQFKKKDAYHLPNLDVSLEGMGAPNDPRIMSHEELEDYARQFHTGEDVNVYDFSKIDFNGPFFQSLPASDRYNILNAARLRSRLRMGYSKEQLDTMFPDRMAFSKFQVERVRERNELTQRLMNINGMNGEEFNGGGRVVGERGKEYVLIKNDGVEGGWALGVVSNKSEGERNKPIDVEGYGKPPVQEEDLSEDEGFEDVPIEGLNRLPKRAPIASSQEYNDDYYPDAMVKRRRALYEKRLEATKKPKPEKRSINGVDIREEEPDSLFLPEEITEQDLDNDGEVEALFEDVPPPAEEDDDELNRAIAMSLEVQDDSQDAKQQADSFDHSYSGPKPDEPLDFNQKNARIGRNFAHMTNARAHSAAPSPFRTESQEEEDFNLQVALEESRKSKHKPQTGPRVHGFKRPDGTASPVSANQNPITSDFLPSKTLSSSQTDGFSGPLPFESLNLGKSILSKKKRQPVPEEEAGGFETEPEEPHYSKPKPPQPLPPWFTGEIGKDKIADGAQGQGREEPEDHEDTLVARIREDRGPIVRQKTGEVIDLDAPPKQSEEVIEVDSSGDDAEPHIIMGDSRRIDNEVRMGDIAHKARVEPPTSSMPKTNTSLTKSSDQELFQATAAGPNKLAEVVPTEDGSAKESDSDVPIEWDESDHEAAPAKNNTGIQAEKAIGGDLPIENSKSPSPDFEDVDVEAQASKILPPVVAETSEIPGLQHDESIDILPADDEEIYSDPEDEDLMRQLAVEAEEHARFASTLNAKTQAQNVEEYEKELRQLRNQQKKDRRDADEVTHVMVTECQQLLKLFGIPYITAPMEAEAQCAELVSLGLVDGIVTDDSDIFLFGGTRVYKNMFNQAKFVECYLTSDLEKEYSLDRQRLIGVAHLLGSDYTEGIPSVGPVTALEILSEFGSLETFAEWCNNVQLAQKLSVEDSANPFRRKFRKQASKIFLPSPFPDKRVDAAYLNPEVDNDPSSFEWGVPDLDSLRSFLMATIGWTQERTDEVLVPVIRDMNRRDVEGTQANITQFFGGGTGAGARQTVKGASNSAFAPRRRVEGKSKRMENALGRLHEQARKGTIGENEAPAGAAMMEAVDASSTVDRAVTEAVTQPKGARANRTRKRAVPKDISGSDSDDSPEDHEYQAPAKVKGTVQTKANSGKRRGVKRSRAS
ncbi:MAG: hypothetical protein LQ339_000424 [Xanthoria mediterranea]|nr:MAG: hypothetical protein LQ339_000424 [Xanthoria mediterranea]